MSNLYIELIKDNATLPTAGSADAAGLDLYAALDSPMTIGPGETKLIGTGLKIALPKGTFGGIFARSGLALKQGLRPANCVGVIDADYRGEVGVALHNDSNETRTINSGDRIAQLIVIPFAITMNDLIKVDTLDDTDRGEGGFGSTGI